MAKRWKTYNIEFEPKEKIEAYYQEVMAYRRTNGVEGRSCSEIEYNDFQDSSSHGRNLTHAIKARLRIDIEEDHPMIIENRRLRALLEANGISPDGDVA
jgi:hypothetical protein